VRVVEYWLEGIADAEPLYRLVTTILDPAAAPAAELAALYHERWEIESALDELKTHLRGARMVLRSKTPELARQEFWGLLLAHFAVRGLMHGTRRRCGPMRTRTGSPSCTRCGWCGASCRCSRPFPPRARLALHEAVLEEILEEQVASSRGRQVPRGVKRKMSNYRLRPRTRQPTTRISFTAAIRIIK
jgi:Transposase DDE domain